MSDLALTLPALDLTNSVTDLALKRSQGLSAAQQLQALPCETPDQEQAFSDLLVVVRGTIKDLESERQKIAKPLHEAKTRVDELFRNARQPWELCEQTIKAKLADAQQRRLEQAAEARKLAAQAAQAQDSAGVVQALAQVPEQSKPSGVSVSHVWEVENWDLSLVPREYLTLDWSKIKLYLAAHKASEHIPPVPGLSFKRTVKVGAR